MSRVTQSAATLLGWVRENLDRQLEQLSAQLEHLAGAHGVAAEALLGMAGKLEDLGLTMRMLELHGAAMLTEEMMQLCTQLGERRVGNRERGFAAILEALVVLPAYLDRVQSGHRDMPLLLQPIINQLRAAHRVSGLHDSALFAPDLEVEIPELDAMQPGQAEPEAFQEVAVRLRRQFEAGMLDWLNEGGRSGQLSPLQGVCETLLHHLQREDLRRTWWIAAEILGGLADGRLHNDKAMRRLLARLHLNLKALTEGGEQSVSADAVRTLSQALLYPAALATPGHKGLDKLKKRFHLKEMLPTQDALLRAKGSVTGKDRAMYESMGAAIRDEFSVIKDALDLELRSGSADPERRELSSEALLRLRDTLALVGLNEQVQSLEELLPVFDFSATVEGRQHEEALHALAHDLLQVESAVHAHIDSLGEPLADSDAQAFIDLPAHEYRKVVSQALDEAIHNVHRFEESIKSRLGGDRETDLETGIREIAGTLELLGMNEAATLISDLADLTMDMFRQVFSEADLPRERLEWYTDAVAAMELLLAALRDQQDQQQRLTAVLRERLDWLSGRGHPADQAGTAGPPATPLEAARAATAARTDVRGGVASAEPLPEAAVVDSELLEVFLEEYDEVLESLQGHLPGWLAKLDDVQQLTEVRRAFHTLKGSSRMVGAFELGDFCWHLEELLNALLDARIDAFADAALMARIAHAALPALKQRLMRQPAGLKREVIDAIAAHAEALAEGGQPDWSGLRSQLPGFLAGMLPDDDQAATVKSRAAPVTDEVHASVCKELRQNLQTVESLLEAVSANRQTVAGEHHVRALHTMAGVLALEPEGEDVLIARRLERALEMQRRTGAPFGHEDIWVLGSCLEYLQSRLERLEGDQEAALPDNGASLVSQLERLQERFEQSPAMARGTETAQPPAAEPEPGVDGAGPAPAEPELRATEPERLPAERDDITRVFLEEAREVLGRFDSLLNTWRDNLGAMALVQNLQREIHTFKGGARMAGLEALGSLSHAMEDLLERAARHEFAATAATVRILEQGCDQLLEWVDQVARGTLPEGGSALQSFLRQIESQPAEATSTQAPAAEPAASEHKVFTDLPEADGRSAGQDAAAPGKNQIRVDAELLDSLIKAAGEVNIFRARVERHVDGIRTNLAEFNETLARLREQFRKLEIETEAQIHSRVPDMAHADDTEFDPLELDRFSAMQQLSRSLSESVTDLLNLEDLLEDSARQTDTLLNQQSRVSTELQEGLMQTLMVPFGSIAPRLRRVVRKAALETGKQARLKLLMAGSSDQLDRNVLERITVPLEHMLRNAIAHGIEKPETRRELGKDPEGEIDIRVESEATEFVIRVEDDGAGINRGAIRQRAIERGLIDESSDPPPQQLFELILGSGFSTSATVTGLAGRGVGMDVVSSEVKQIGGSLEIESEEGHGTCFTIRIPFTLAVMQAIGVLAGGQRYMIPLTSVAGVARVRPDKYRALLESEQAEYEFAEQSYPILELEPLLGEPARPLTADSVSLLMIETGDQRAALRVTELLGHREVVIKPVGPQITSIPGILGGTVTGDGRVVVILDPGPIIRQALLHGVRPVLAERQPDQRERRKVGMVVDDSITMRRINSRVLQSQDIEPITARDGQEAVEMMQDRVPDILLLDIEMPHMDGYQLAEYVRGDARLRHIPIVMITSRSGDKHRERARRAGANAYLTKPYKEAELIGTIQNLLAEGER